MLSNKINDLDDSSKNLTLFDYYNIVLNHQKKIIFFIILGFSFTIYNSYSTPPIFKSTSIIMIKEQPGSAFVMNLGGGRCRDRITNEIQKIRSRTVALKVVEEMWNSKKRNNLFLFGTRKFYPKGYNYRTLFKELFTLGLYNELKNTPVSFSEKYTEKIGHRYSDQILNNLEIKSKRATDLITITYKSRNASEATLIANKIALVYKDLEEKWGNENAVKTVAFLEKLVLVQEDQLIDAEEIIKNFKLENSIYDITSNISDLSNQLNTFENSIYSSLAEINIRRQKKDILSSQLTESQKVLAQQLSSDINGQMVVLRLEISSLESQIIKYTSLYGENHNAVLDLIKKVDALKFQMNNKVEMLINDGYRLQDPLKDRQSKIIETLILDSEIIGLELQISEFEKLKNIYKIKLTTIPKKELELQRFQRNLTVLNSNYSFLRQKLEEAKISLASTSGNIQIIDFARQSDWPVSPNHQRDLLLGFFISIFFILAIIVIIELLDNSLRDPNEVIRQNLTILGIIPSIENNTPSFKKNTSSKSKNKNEIQRTLITREDPRSPISEAYRSLRTSMLYTETDKKIKSILVSSAGPGEGKTTTVANMAITYANLGKKTLLIDTDLRRPVIHKVLNINKEPGITNYLAGHVDDFSSLVQKTGIENLYAVTSGVIPPNPSELLGSEKMNKLIESLEHKWDILLFDSPPLVAVTDATMVSKSIDKIIIVVKVGQTDKRAFEHTIQNLRNVNAPIGGVVLNAVSQKNSYGSYYYYYQYYNYYGKNN